MMKGIFQGLHGNGVLIFSPIGAGILLEHNVRYFIGYLSTDDPDLILS
jgi:hypothetical protein